MMKSILNHNDWVSALSNNELSAFDVIQLGRDKGASFIWHPLGFIFCELSKERERKIRLHIWPNNNDRMQKPAWLIHDHLFNLKSWVVAGRIENIEYSVEEGTPNYRVYYARYEGDSSVLYRTDKEIFITENIRYLVSAGEGYSVLSGVLHQSVSVSETTSVTVCETIDQPNIIPSIAGDISGVDKYSYIRVKVDESDLQSIIAKI
jgi:hypothetical protein